MYRIIFLIIASSFLQAQNFEDASQRIPGNISNGNCMDVEVADIDADGDLDIILAMEFQRNAILINDGNGNFEDATSERLPNVIKDSENIIVRDLNGDKWVDIIFCSEDDYIVNSYGIETHEYYLNDMSGRFQKAEFSIPNSIANSIASDDINGDFLPDIVLGNSGQNWILIGNGRGEFVNETATRLPLINETTQDIKLIDIDNDGDKDILVGSEYHNLILVNDGQGNFSDETNERIGTNPLLLMETRKIVPGDIDSDGDIDLYLCNVAWQPLRTLQDRLLINDGNGFFEDKTEELLPTFNDFSLDAIIKDFDSDGDNDILVVNVNNQPHKILVNDGDKFSINELIIDEPIVSQCLSVVSADFNGDGVDDLYFGNRGQQDRLLFGINPTSTVEIKKKIKVFPNPANDYLKIQSHELIKHVKIVDLNGEIVQTHTDIANGYIDISSLPKGTYFIKIQIDDKEITEKFVK